MIFECLLLSELKSQKEKKMAQKEKKKTPNFPQSAGFLIDKDAHKNPNFNVFKFESASLDFLLASC